MRRRGRMRRRRARRSRLRSSARSGASKRSASKRNLTSGKGTSNGVIVPRHCTARLRRALRNLQPVFVETYKRAVTAGSLSLRMRPMGLEALLEALLEGKEEISDRHVTRARAEIPNFAGVPIEEHRRDSTGAVILLVGMRRAGIDSLPEEARDGLLDLGERRSRQGVP